MKKPLLLFIMSVWMFSVNAQNYTDSIPIRLKSFEASRMTNSNKLDWSVICFLNYAKFDIQRSSDGINFTTINSFQADQFRCRQPFTYQDKTANGKTFYRIKVGNLDGKEYVSKITVLIGKATGFDIASMAPTLVTSAAILTITSADNDAATITIANLQGAPVMKKLIKLSKGNNEIRLDLSTLSFGNYVLSCLNSDGELKTIRMIKR